MLALAWHQPTISGDTVREWDMLTWRHSLTGLLLALVVPFLGLRRASVITTIVAALFVTIAIILRRLDLELLRVTLDFSLNKARAAILHLLIQGKC